MSKVRYTRLYFPKRERGSESNFNHKYQAPSLYEKRGLVVSVYSFLFLLLKEANPVMKSV